MVFCAVPADAGTVDQYRWPRRRTAKRTRPIWSIWVRSTPNALARLLCPSASDALRRDVATSGTGVGPAKRWGVRSTAGLKLFFDASDSISARWAEVTKPACAFSASSAMPGSPSRLDLAPGWPRGHGASATAPVPRRPAVEVRTTGTTGPTAPPPPDGAWTSRWMPPGSVRPRCRWVRHRRVLRRGRNWLSNFRAVRP
jgi:hypothetical protein